MPDPEQPHSSADHASPYSKALGRILRSCHRALPIAFNASRRASQCFGRVNMRSLLRSPLVVVGKGLKLTRNCSVGHGLGGAKQSLRCLFGVRLSSDCVRTSRNPRWRAIEPQPTELSIKLSQSLWDIGIAPAPFLTQIKQSHPERWHCQAPRATGPANGHRRHDEKGTGFGR